MLRYVMIVFSSDGLFRIFGVEMPRIVVVPSSPLPFSHHDFDILSFLIQYNVCSTVNVL